MDEILELDTRRKIFDLVSRNPGLHLSKIAEILQMSVQLVEYHLLYLEKNVVIYAERESGFTRYYVKGDVGIADKKALSLLRQEVPLKITLFLLKNNYSQHKDILKNCNVAPSTLSYHLKKLVNHEIISVQTYGENRGYSIRNKEEIIRLLVHYKPYSVLESFRDIWEDFDIE
jgi:predicted transcriptional regulator